MRNEEIIVIHHQLMDLVAKIGIYFDAERDQDSIAILKKRISESGFSEEMNHLISDLINHAMAE